MSINQRIGKNSVVYLNSTAVKNNDIMMFDGRWKELEKIILCEVTQMQIDKYSKDSLLSGYYLYVKGQSCYNPQTEETNKEFSRKGQTTLTVNTEVEYASQVDRERGLDSGWAWEQDGSGDGRMEVENIGRDNWNHGYLWDEPET